VVLGIVAEVHRAVVVRSGQHIQVVHRVAGRRDAGTVITPRHEERVAVEHGDIGIDFEVGVGEWPGVGAVHAEAVRRVVRRAGLADAEVVDLLVVDVAFGRVVVLVRRVRRPVAVGRKHFDTREFVGVVPVTGAHEVVDLASGLTPTAHFDHDVVSCPVFRLVPLGRFRRAHRELPAALAAHPHRRVDADIQEVTDPIEHRRPTFEFEGLIFGDDRAAAR